MNIDHYDHLRARADLTEEQEERLAKHQEQYREALAALEAAILLTCQEGATKVAIKRAVSCIPQGRQDAILEQVPRPRGRIPGSVFSPITIRMLIQHRAGVTFVEMARAHKLSRQTVRARVQGLERYLKDLTVEEEAAILAKAK